MFVEAWNKKAAEVNETAKAKGWWDRPEWVEAAVKYLPEDLAKKLIEATDRNNGEIIALAHSELSEGLEALRHGNPPDDHIPEFSGVEAEMADAVIRIMDFGKARGLRIAEAIEAKIAYNANRPHKHGGKAF